MTVDLTFDGVCKSIKDDYPDVMDDISTFSDIAVTFSVAAAAGPIAAVAVTGAATLSPAMIALLAVGTLANLFAVKDKIFQGIERIISKVISGKDKDPLQQMRCMERAYYLICYTAFFEALVHEKELATLLKKVKMKPEEKAIILASAMREQQGKIQATVDYTSEDTRGNLFKFQIDLPHPGDTLQTEHEKLRPLYKQLAASIEYFFTSLALWEKLHESERVKAKVTLEKLSDKALQYFEAQYYVLAAKCPSFAKWLNYKESDKARVQLSSIEQKLVTTQVKGSLDG